MDKRYYWIKLKDTMFTSDAVDFLMSQKEGAKYIVLYQMLCLETIKTNGELVRQIGEIIIPYDVDKIQRDCKYFDRDTVIVALGLYEKLGLVYMQDNGYLRISNYENMVGSEGSSAERMRNLRTRERLLIASQCDTESDKKVTIEKEKEKEKEIEKDIFININMEKGASTNSPNDNIKSVKHKYGKYNNVLLTDEEHKKLQNDYTNANNAIEFLSEYREMKGYKAKSDYLAIKKWVFDAIKENQQRKDRINGTHVRDFEERTYSEKETASVVSSIDETDLESL